MNTGMDYDFIADLNTSNVNGSNISISCTNDYCDEGVSDEEYVDMIVGYIKPTPSEWVLILVYFVVFIVGIIGNFLVCFSVWRNHSMRTVTNYFIGKHGKRGHYAS